MKLGRDLRIIYGAAFLRSLAIGQIGIVLGIYVSRSGFSSLEAGAVIAAGLAGMAAATAVISFRGDIFGRRRTLIALSLLACVGGMGLAFERSVPVLCVLAFLGMLNSSGSDRGGAFVLDQAAIPQTVSGDRRTPALSGYHFVLDAGHALGALAAALLYHWAFAFYIACNLLSAACYLALSLKIEPARAADSVPAKLSRESRKIITKLAALFAVDSLGGGFLTDALMVYWFVRRFGVSGSTLGPIFFLVHLLNLASYPVAAWLARRVGLLNTMVFTHIPSSLFLIAIPFAKSFGGAIVLFLAREALVEMDVPTRQSYVLAVVQPHERTLATGIGSLARNISWAAAPTLAGYLMQSVSLAAPLFAGGGLKIAYDLLLYGAFRRLKPPEEEGGKS